jgi:hypothetical protein
VVGLGTVKPPLSPNQSRGDVRCLGYTSCVISWKPKKSVADLKEAVWTAAGPGPGSNPSTVTWDSPGPQLKEAKRLLAAALGQRDRQR